MITAFEARNLVKLSDKKVSELLSIIEKEIVKAANEGQSYLILDNVLYIPELRLETITFFDTVPHYTEIQKLLKSKLETFGYKIGTHINSNAGVRLGCWGDDDDDNQKPEITLQFKISW